MPADTNTAGDIFGGWVLSQMDLASGNAAAEHARSRVTTVGIEAMSFLKAVHVGDILSVYCRVIRVGKTSMAVEVEAWVHRRLSRRLLKVTDGVFTFVALDEDGQKLKVPQLD
ncbi:MAG: acyl-CoA thioesterase YciA [Paracoccaceae bacterium]|jgi:acyl-CoA thioesterase YciA